MGEGPAGVTGPSLMSRVRAVNHATIGGTAQQCGATGWSEPVCRYVSDT